MAKRSFKRCHQVVLALLVALGSSACQRADVPLEIQDAHLDLSGVELSSQKLFRLDGRWAFWPGEFLSVERLQEPTWRSDRAIDRWEPNQRVRSGDPRFEKPYGTLAAGVRLAPGTNKFALQMTSISNALTLMFVAEGEPFEVIELGQPNADSALEVVHPGVQVMQVEVPKGLQSFDFVIHYSNHRSMRDGAFNSTLRIGEFRSLRDHSVWRVIEVALLVGVLLALCFYHCAIYALNTADKAPLYFSGMALGFTGMLLYSVQFFLEFVQSPSRAIVDFVLGSYIYYNSLVTVCLGGLILTLFRAPRLRVLFRVIVFSLLLACGLTFTLGPEGTLATGVFFNLPVAVGGAALLVHLIVLSVRRVQFARLLVLSILLYVAAGVHDLLMFHGWIESVWISQYGCVVFIAIQGYILSVRNSEAYRLANRSRDELEHEVELQTHALQTQTVEAEHLRKLAEKQAVELREYDERKTRFFQNISHELRTPLTLMLHPLDAALKNHGDDEDLVVARRNCGRLLRLVNQLLDFQKLSVGTQELKLGPLDAVSFLRVASDYFASSSAHRLLTFSVTVDGESVTKSERRVGVIGELDALEKVIFNYLSNAMKFSPDGGSIELGIVVNPTLVRFFVRDTGPGIREEDTSKLFQIFSQLDDSSTRAYEGTGLGLALCKTLAAQMNGEVGVESTYGHGATFWLELERTDAEAPTLDDSFRPKDWLMDWADHLPEPGGELEGTGGQEHVLVVDDLGDMRNMIGRILGERGYRVSYAGDGEAALELMAHGLPDLVITDWMMPRMDGLGLVQSLRSEVATEGLPIIMLTAKSDEGSKLEGLGGGADAFLGKPFSELELVSTVHNLMNLKANEKSLEAYSNRLEDTLEALKLAELKNIESARLSTIGQLASGLAHELRNPLNVILGVAETIAEADEATPVVRLLTQASERANGVVERLITLSETRSYELSSRVGDAFASMSDIVMSELDRLGLKLEIIGDLELEVGLGRAELSQILVQVVQNAAEASSKEGKIRLEASSCDEWIWISIEDDGHGVDEAIQSNIFDAFFTTRLGRNASGLGLTIARRMLNGVDGDILLERRADPTVFKVKVKGLTASE